MIDLFVPTYSADLEQLRVLLRSLDTYLQPDAVASLNIAAIDRPESFETIQQLQSVSFRACTRYLRPRDLGLQGSDGTHDQGWSLQQVAKLVFARQAKSAFYMVLDSKNFALRPVTLTDLVRNGRAPWVLEDVAIHAIWWRGSAWALAHPTFDRTPGRQALSAATPVVFHTASVNAMLDWIERHHGVSIEQFLMRRRRLVRYFMRPTEFSLYFVFMDREGLLDQYHFPSDRLHAVSTQIWSTQTPEVWADRLRLILTRQTSGLFSGIQRDAWRAMTADDKCALYAAIGVSAP